MKKILSTLLLASVFMLALGSCSKGLRPLQRNYVKVEPETLEVVASQVPAKVHITFPAKWFPKKTVLSITPVLRYAGGEKWGTSYSFQGEKVYGNDPVIPYAKGANVTLNFSVPYLKQMNKSKLFLVFRVKGSDRKIADLEVAQGVVGTEMLASATSAIPAIAPDGFQRIIKESYDASIQFQIQQATVRGSELNKADVTDWKNLVQQAKESDNQRVNVEVQAYASPDGGQKLNERLSEAREKNTTASLKREFGKQRIGNLDINAHYTAQDWEGFKTLVEQSSLQDKDLVLRVLSMYPDPEQREREIRNISAVFSQLADEILPKLRRSRLVANIEIIGKSDEEIKSFIEKAPKQLDINELLYAATLAQTSEQKESIYQLITKLHPKDYRAYNNLGTLLYQRGALDQAQAYFNAAQSKQDNPYSNINNGLLALAKGDLTKATSLISLGANVPEVAPALGLLYLKQGEYTKAAAAFGSTISNNAAVAQLLSGDYSRALSTLGSLAKPDAMSFLLKAIVGARTNDANLVMSSLSKALAMDGKLVSLVADNLEFAKYATTPDFVKLLASVMASR